MLSLYKYASKFYRTIRKHKKQLITILSSPHLKDLLFLGTTSYFRYFSQCSENKSRNIALPIVESGNLSCHTAEMLQKKPLHSAKECCQLRFYWLVKSRGISRDDDLLCNSCCSCQSGTASEGIARYSLQAEIKSFIWYNRNASEWGALIAANHYRLPETRAPLVFPVFSGMFPAKNKQCSTRNRR